MPDRASCSILDGKANCGIYLKFYNHKINPKPVTFLLDTGATLISIPETIARQLQLAKGYPVQSRTANGSIEVFATKLDSVSIGAIEINNIRRLLIHIWKAMKYYWE